MEISEARLMWVVGIIEGEGAITWRSQSSGSGPRVAVKMSDQDTVQRVYLWTGLGHLGNQRDAKPGTLGTKPLWEWRIQGYHDFFELAYAIEPHLMSRRLGQLRRVMDLAIAHRADVLEREAMRRDVCPRGHDKGALGRKADGSCRTCSVDQNRERRRTAARRVP